MWFWECPLFFPSPGGGFEYKFLRASTASLLLHKLADKPVRSYLLKKEQRIIMGGERVNKDEV